MSSKLAVTIAKVQNRHVNLPNFAEKVEMDHCENLARLYSNKLQLHGGQVQFSDGYKASAQGALVHCCVLDQGTLLPNEEPASPALDSVPIQPL